jgi:hypothetical protein
MNPPPRSRFDLLLVATKRLSLPTIPSRVVRPEFHGEVVARFILPLELCQAQNSKRSERVWTVSKRKSALRGEMWKCVRPARVILSGRPQVLCVRFSAVEPDKYADWGKEAVDVLCRKTARHPTRLNIIHDDAPRYADVHQWWEQAAPKEGFVYIEVRTGKAEG